MKRILRITALMLLGLNGCRAHRHEVAKTKTVHVFKQYVSVNGINSNGYDYLYWYIIYGSDSTYYVASSPSALSPSSYSTMQWTRSTGIPAIVKNNSVKEEGEEEVETESLGKAVEQEMQSDAEAQEAVSETASEPSATESSTESSTSASSDAGSDSSGGGDGSGSSD